MATVKEIKATARPRAGKGAARAMRRHGRVPGVIYGDGQPPLNISLDYADLRQKIYAGGFLTSVYQLELDGAKHRVIPRDFQLDPVRDFPIHVDFMRLSTGRVIRVEVPVHFPHQDASPGLMRANKLNIGRHTVELLAPAEAIPEFLSASLSGLDINDGIHI